MIKIENYLKDFKLHMRRDRCSKNTIKAYIADIKKFLEYTDKDPLEIEDMDIVDYSVYLEELIIDSKGEKNKPLSAKTINRKLYAIYKYTNYLNERYELNITLKMKRLKVKITEVPYGKNVLTKTEFKKILNFAEKNDDILFATILKVMYLTGMRISEVLSLKITDIDRKEVLCRSKGRKDRYVPFSKQLREQFKKYIKVRNNKNEEETALFTNRNGNPVSAWSCDYYMKKYARAVKVSVAKAHCHNVRHLFGYICLNERGLSLTAVALLMGHSDINTTKQYLNETKKQLIDNAQDFKLE